MWPFESAEPQPMKVEQSSLPIERQAPDIDVERFQVAYPPTSLMNGHERLNLIFPVRLPLAMGAALIGGLAIGGAKGGFIAADRYRAENAHRLPVSRSGWYLYHKSKNYHSIIGSLREGTKQGLILMAWAALFTTTEEVIDRARARLFARYDGDDEDSLHKQRDVASTVMAGLTVSGIYSWKQRFDQFGAARMAKVSLKYSLVYGLLQDALAALRGNRPGYMKWLFGNPTASTSMEPI